MHLIILILITNFCFAQSKTEIDSLLNIIAETKDSKEITKTEQAKTLIEYGWKILPNLADFFIDSTETEVKSGCIERNLNIGELAIIIADRIEGMPYSKVTGIQNCLGTFCEKNLNFIEYYLDFIKRDGIKVFQTKYNQWLLSEERIEYKPIFDFKSQAERKKIIKEKKKAKRELQNNK